MPRNNGIERWRGEVTAHLADISRRLDELGIRFEKALGVHVIDDTTRFERIDVQLSEVERLQSRIVGKMAVVAVLGSAITAAIAEAAIRHLFG